jgi:hypothetical protein
MQLRPGGALKKLGTFPVATGLHEVFFVGESLMHRFFRLVSSDEDPFSVQNIRLALQAQVMLKNIAVFVKNTHLRLSFLTRMLAGIAETFEKTLRIVRIDNIEKHKMAEQTFAVSDYLTEAGVKMQKFALRVQFNLVKRFFHVCVWKKHTEITLYLPVILRRMSNKWIGKVYIR